MHSCSVIFNSSDMIYTSPVKILRVETMKHEEEKKKKKKKKQQEEGNKGEKVDFDQEYHQLMIRKSSCSCLLCCFSFLGSFWRAITTKSSTSSGEESKSIADTAPDKTLPPSPCKQQQQQQQQQQQVVPWLMLSKVDRHEKSRSFFSLDKKQVHKIKFSNAANWSWCSGSSDGWLVMSHKTRGNFLYNPMTRKRINLPPHEIISYIEGEKYLDQRLRNLYKHNRVYFMDKAIVSSVPTISTNNSSFSDLDDNIVVAVIYERSCKDGFSGVGFCRPGDKEWCNVPFHDYGDHNYLDASGDQENMVPIIQGNPEAASLEGEGCEDYNGDEEEEDNNSEEDEEEEEEEDDDDDDDEAYYLEFAADIIFYKGAFYVATRTRKLGIIDISSSSSNDNNKLKGTVRWPDIQPLRLKKSEKYILNNYYLVESCGELLMVIRILREKTKKFLVFKLDETGDTLKWVRVESLGDQILFVGSNYSKAVSASEMPGFKGNCIYFTDGTRYLFMRTYIGSECFRDIGVFYLEDERIEPIFPNDDCLSYYRKYCSSRKYTPTFITPNPSPYMAQ